MRSFIAAISLLVLTLCAYAHSATAPRPARSDAAATDERLIPRRPASKSRDISIAADAVIDRVIVKLVAGSRGRLSRGRLVSLGGNNLDDVNRIIGELPPGTVKRLIDKSPVQVERDRFILENRSGHQLADFNNYFTIAVSSPAEAEALVRRLNRSPAVEIAYAEPRPAIAGDIDPPTPDFDTLQAHLRAAPTGIGADYIWTVPGGTGTGVRVVDIEGNWRFDHEDLESAATGLIGGDLVNDYNWRHHGTAVIGIITGGDNGFGITGIVPDADIGMVSIGGIGMTEAILLAVDSLEAGDILMIELNAAGPRYNFQVREDQKGYVCMEYWQANFDAIQLAWAKGIIVCQAAGNGQESLDDPLYENRFDTAYRNSHAIIVGAGAPPSGNYGPDRSWMWPSNYGSRVNLQGYGHEVVTTGYGDLFNGGGDERQFYTAGFNGTSAATPMVAGAAAALQGIYMNRYSGAVLTADRLRDVLVATGSPQQSNPGAHVGPRPDLRAADSALPPPPDLALDPTYFDTVVDLGTQLVVYFQMHNHASDKSLEYSITASDSLLKNSSWLTITNPTGTIASLDAAAIEVVMDAAFLDDRTQIYKGLIDIAYGDAGGPLDKQAVVPVFVTVPCADTTYAVSASFDPGGPAFEWIDITAVGIKIAPYSWYNDFVTEEIIDDGTAGPYFLGFDFPFYDSLYRYIFIGANGGLSFTDTNVNVNGYYGSVPIPNPPFATFVAPFWNDLNLDPDAGGHGSVYFYRSFPNDTFIVEFFQAGNYNSADDTLTSFQAIITKNGNIKFQYLSVGNTGLQDSAIVGIAENDCASVPYVLQGDPAAHIMADSNAVFFDYAPIVWEMSGDINSDGNVNVGDAVYLVNWIFKSGPAPKRLKEADANCDGAPNIGDAVYIVSYIFKSGPDPCLYEL